MKDSKHTPGPWVAGQFNIATPSASYLVKGKGASAGELSANATLIAAAPDLLEVLISISEAIPEIMDPECDEPLSGADIVDIISQYSRDIRDAIAKAKGTQ